jgi:hypothetical protein
VLVGPSSPCYGRKPFKNCRFIGVTKPQCHFVPPLLSQPGEALDLGAEHPNNT